MNFDLKAYLKEKRYAIDAALEALMGQDDTHARLIAAMRYSLMANGKRLRPVLCIAAAEAVGGHMADVMPAACSLEMVHTYSLVHDDLPAMDNDDLRRGQPTCHVAFDEATAVLAGDALLTFAFMPLAQAALQAPEKTSKWIRVITLIAHAAGHKGMIAGQMLDMQAEGHNLDLSALKELHGLKTGAIIEASLAAGAVIADAAEDVVEQLCRYGRHIGLAFQVTDDILNVEGDPSFTGKSTGTDAARQKCTYPSLLGLEPSKAYARDLVNRALQVLNVFDKKADPLRAVARYIIERKR